MILWPFFLKANPGSNASLFPSMGRIGSQTSWMSNCMLAPDCIMEGFFEPCQSISVLGSDTLTFLLGKPAVEQYSWLAKCLTLRTSLKVLPTLHNNHWISISLDIDSLEEKVSMIITDLANNKYGISDWADSQYTPIFKMLTTMNGPFYGYEFSSQTVRMPFRRVQKTVDDCGFRSSNMHVSMQSYAIVPRS